MSLPARRQVANGLGLFRYVREGRSSNCRASSGRSDSRRITAARLITGSQAWATPDTRYTTALRSAAYAVAKPLVRWAAKKLDYRCAVSEDAARTASDALGGEYEVVFNGIDMSFDNPSCYSNVRVIGNIGGVQPCFSGVTFGYNAWVGGTCAGTDVQLPSLPYMNSTMHAFACFRGRDSVSRA